jgi:pyruvate,water dikinase
MKKYILFFDEITIGDIPLVGGKNASLGEMIQHLVPLGIRIPDGFATTSAAYWDFLEENKIKTDLFVILDSLDRKNYANLATVGQKARDLILGATLPG